MSVPAGRCRAGLAGQAEGDAVQEGAQGRGPADGPRPAGQDEEGRLESILGGVIVPQHPPADAQDHRPVPGDKRAEGGLVALAREGVKQRGVRPWGFGESLQVAQQVGSRSGHGGPPSGRGY
jgi:hypothetical protein